jgi:hypothetical protein
MHCTGGWPRRRRTSANVEHVRPWLSAQVWLWPLGRECASWRSRAGTRHGRGADRLMLLPQQSHAARRQTLQILVDRARPYGHLLSRAGPAVGMFPLGAVISPNRTGVGRGSLWCEWTDGQT